MRAGDGGAASGPYSLPEYVDGKVDYGVASMPSFGGEHTTIAGPDTWAIFDNGDDRVAAALEFMDWFSQPEQQLRWISEAGSLPLTNDIQETLSWTPTTHTCGNWPTVRCAGSEGAPALNGTLSPCCGASSGR